MLTDSSAPQSTSTINFRLKNTATTTFQVQFVGRDIKVCDLKEKIAERLHAQSGATLQLYEAGSNKLLTDADERISAFSEILVVRTNEIQQGSFSSSNNGLGYGGGPSAQQKEKTAGALGTMAAARKAALEANARKAELDFGSTQTQVNQNVMMAHQHGNNNNASGINNNNSATSKKSEEDRILELQDIVGRVEGDRTAAGRGRGGGGAGSVQLVGRGGGNSGPNFVKATETFGAGRSVTAGGEAMKAAPSASYICHLCGNSGHYIEHCPLKSEGGGRGGRGGGGGGGQQHFTRRFAQPIGIPESELEKCEPEDAMFITRDGHYVRRKLVGLGGGVDTSVEINNSSKNTEASSAPNAPQPIIKCMHCQKTYNNDIKQFQKLPCNCDTGRIACKKCVDDFDCFEMTDDGPVCNKCKKEIDADEIVDAKIEDFPTKNVGGGGQRRERD